MTEKEMLLAAVEGVLRQGGKSMDGGKCRYRAPNGRKCAVGHLIEDRRYEPRIESHTADYREVIDAIGLEDPKVRTVSLLRELQTAHDESSDAHSFMMAVKDVSMAHEIDVDRETWDRFYAMARQISKESWIGQEVGR